MGGIFILTNIKLIMLFILAGDSFNYVIDISKLIPGGSENTLI